MPQERKTNSSANRDNDLRPSSSVEELLLATAATHAGQREVGTGDYIRGFHGATEAIMKVLGINGQVELDLEEEVLVAGATWGLTACRVPHSAQSGAGITIAVLDTGMDTH